MQHSTRQASKQAPAARIHAVRENRLKEGLPQARLPRSPSCKRKPIVPLPWLWTGRFPHLPNRLSRCLQCANLASHAQKGVGTDASQRNHANGREHTSEQDHRATSG